MRLSLSRVHTWNNRGSNSDMAARNSARIQSYVRGYHVYKRIWTPFIGEMATTTIENANPHDRYAIAVLESETLCCVEHIHREISRDCAFFIRTGGTVKVEVTGERKRSGLPQGGMEIPCRREDIEQSKEASQREGFSRSTCRRAS